MESQTNTPTIQEIKSVGRAYPESRLDIINDVLDLLT